MAGAVASGLITRWTVDHVNSLTFNQQLKAKDTEIANLKTENTNLKKQDDNAELNAKITVLTTENDNLKNEKTKKEEELTTTKQLLEKKENDIVGLNAQIAALSGKQGDKVKNLMDQLKLKTDEITNLQTQYQTEKEKLTQEINEKETEIQKLKDEIKNKDDIDVDSLELQVTAQKYLGAYDKDTLESALQLAGLFREEVYGSGNCKSKTGNLTLLKGWEGWLLFKRQVNDQEVTIGNRKLKLSEMIKEGILNETQSPEEVATTLKEMIAIAPGEMLRVINFGIALANRIEEAAKQGKCGLKPDCLPD